MQDNANILNSMEIKLRCYVLRMSLFIYLFVPDKYSAVRICVSQWLEINMVKMTFCVSNDIVDRHDFY